MIKIKEFLKKVISIMNSSSKVETLSNTQTFDSHWELQSGSFLIKKYRGIVFINATVKLKNGTSTSSTICTLPVECKALYNPHFLIHGSGVNLGEVVIDEDRSVHIYQYGSSTSSLTNAQYVRLHFSYPCQ